MTLAVLAYTCASFLGVSGLGVLANCCVNKEDRPTTSHVLSVLSLVACYYSVSIAMSVCNKWLLTDFADGGFKFPVSITAVHLVLKFIIASLFLGCPACRRSRQPLFGSLTRRDLWTLIVPIGFATAFDISLSNFSLLYLSLALYTIGKTSSILFNYSFSMLLRLQPFRCALAMVVFFIFLGMVTATYKSTSFHLLGFVAIILAAATAACRWVVTEKYFEKHNRKMQAIELLYLISPIAVPAIIPFAAFLEGKDLIASPVWSNHHDLTVMLAAVLGAGFTSFLLILLELAIVNRTSALTTDVLGYGKNLTLIVLSALTYEKPLSKLNSLGVVVTFASAFLYSYLQSRGGVLRRKGPMSNARVAYEILSVLEMSRTWSDDDSNSDSGVDSLPGGGRTANGSNSQGRGSAAAGDRRSASRDTGGGFSRATRRRVGSSPSQGEDEDEDPVDVAAAGRMGARGKPRSNARGRGRSRSEKRGVDSAVRGDLDDIIARFGQSDDDDDDFLGGGGLSTFVFLDDEAPAASSGSHLVDMRALPISAADSADEGGVSSDSGSMV